LGRSADNGHISVSPDLHNIAIRIGTMNIDRKTAKALCNAEEFKIYEMAQPKKLTTLSQVELRNLVVRSRAIRDKWRDVSRGQRRTTQATTRARQTDSNARSHEKADLFAQIHQAFVDFEKSVKKGQASLPKGKKPLDVPKKDRQIVNRAVRSVVQGELNQTKRKINRASRSSEPQKSSTAAAAAAEKSKAPARSTAKKKPAKGKVPTASPARKKALAKRAEVAAQKAASSEATAPKTTKGSASPQPTKSATAARNRSAHAKATSARVARGGAPRIQGHVSAKGKRAQARRDSKS
jgi:hypothetical protein